MTQADKIIKTLVPNPREILDKSKEVSSRLPMDYHPCIGNPKLETLWWEVLASKAIAAYYSGDTVWAIVWAREAVKLNWRSYDPKWNHNKLAKPFKDLLEKLYPILRAAGVIP